MKILVATLMIGLLIGCGGGSKGDQTSGGSSWTLFRGDAGLSGYSDTRLPDKPALLWTYKSGERTLSSPLIYQGTAYWSDRRGRIYGIDATGQMTFDYDFATAVEATPMISDSVLYLGRIDGFISALSLKGDLLWSFETMGQISASPNIGLYRGRDALVVGSYDNFLYCLDKNSGEELSRFESGYYINGAVAVQKNFFFSGGCDAWLRILDGETGRVSDSIMLDTYIPASPAIDGNSCYIADHSGNVYAIELEAGKIRSSRKIVEASSESASFVSVPAISASTLYILSDDRYLYAVNRKTGSVSWKFLQKGISGESSPLVCRDKLICCSKSGVVSIVDARDGSLLWEFDTGEPIVASPAVVAGRFYILTAKGTLFCFGTS
ncbi:MAG: PQQ-binding-like beta-propeller repeat protein [Tannerellaceae bacterium]|jgi:outer membrane protein assembly factor BamB|nr:PQQ-binding-like beta-propeller repeat protein [Tannerellaceae bacterium]